MTDPEKKRRKPKVQKPLSIERQTQVSRPKELRSNSSEKSQMPKEQASLKSDSFKKSTNDRKLENASEARRKNAGLGKNKTVSEKSKQFEGQVRAGKKEILKEHLERKAKQRADLTEQKASLQKEIKAMNKIAEVRETVDTQYTAKYSCWESAISVGAKGAASTGLRKLDPSIAINLARQQAGASLKAKLEPKVQAQLAKIASFARDLKIANVKALKEPVVAKAGPMPKDPAAASQKIVNSELRQKLKDMKEREIMRDPNRNPGKFEEVNLPARGVGGLGGI